VSHPSVLSYPSGIWRHRYITDTWGWEVPAGWVEPGEDPEAAIRREIEEETGYTVGHIEPMVSYNALSGISTMRFAVYLGVNPAKTGPPTDGAESLKIYWSPLSDIPRLIRQGELRDGPSLTALSFYLGIVAPPFYRARNEDPSWAPLKDDC
jgi:8-oxo-dGTP pyrophosphatase MutT (NUDIX family)